MSLVSVIRNKSDIVEYIHSHGIGELERSGSTIRGCCPICNGDNPTEFVANERVFHCHKCKCGGNIINFVQYYYKMSYSQAIEKIADELNIDYANSPQYQAERNLVKTYQPFVDDCAKRIHLIQNYLEAERKIPIEVAVEFDLGYTKEGAICIPIHDVYGRVVAIARRQFDKKPKYINSKNNILFEKASTLFNLHRARLLLHNTLYVTEGYFDSMAGHAEGLPVVAYLGSELTKAQIGLIKSVCINPETTVVICADNDDAGLASIKRTRENFRSIAPSLSVRVIVMPTENHPFLDYQTGIVNYRPIKDLNDLRLQGISIASVPTKHIDQFCLEEILAKCPDIQTQYVAVGEFIKSVQNPMIRNDIAKFLAVKWEQDIGDIKKWFAVVDKPEDDANLFKTATQCLQQLEEEISAGFLPLGFPILDKSLKGLRKKDVLLIGAYPSTGKTFFAGQLLLNFVLSLKMRVLFFSLEMSGGGLMERLAACLMGISTDELIRRVQSGELAETYEKIKALLEKYIRVIDDTGLTSQDIDRIIKQANMTQFSQPVDIIIIDYLQIMGNTATFEAKEANAQSLKPLAKNNNVLCIALSQLSRGTEVWQRPTMNKLKGGGSNEAVGDFILMLYKKCENPTISLEKQNELKDTITVSIEKGRRGYNIKEVDIKIDQNTTTMSEIPIKTN